MGNKSQKLRAVALRQLRLARPSQNAETRAIAALSKLESSAQPDLFKQADLLHVEAVLVSEGINDNDDGFTREELKRAISSPILKPMNWQHKDDKILGAMYAVEARDLKGNAVAEIGDEPVELVIQGVVWHHLPHIKATAEEIVRRIQKGDLFVSMECWFDDYEYGLYTQAGELFDLYPRNNDTAFLDGYLRANGGVGKYNGMRIGRALSGINFGGVAFVDRPANKRSHILNQFQFDPREALVEAGKNTDGLDQDHQVVTNNVVRDVKPPMEVTMNDLNRAAASSPEQIQDAVQRALAAQKKAEADERVKADLTTAQTNVAALEGKLKNAETALAELKAEIDRAFESAKAGAVPEEIAKIDRALDVKGAGAGDAVFAAKIAWIEQSRAAAQKALAGSKDAGVGEKLTKENESLKKELASLKSEIRKAELEHLFVNILEGVLDEKEAETFIKAGLALETDAAYTAWMDEKKIFAKKMLELKPKDKKDKECASEDAEAGLLEPKDKNTPIEKQAVLRPDRGRVPAVPRTPRNKLGAAAVADLDAMFEEVEEPNLAGATGAGEGSGETPMGKLVAGLFPAKGKQKANKED